MSKLILLKCSRTKGWAGFAKSASSPFWRAKNGHMQGTDAYWALNYGFAFELFRKMPADIFCRPEHMWSKALAIWKIGRFRMTLLLEHFLRFHLNIYTAFRPAFNLGSPRIESCGHMLLRVYGSSLGTISCWNRAPRLSASTRDSGPSLLPVAPGN